jgi:ABC-type nitrate/sulfonate/bicarbonate transport system substrate-binding protein
MTDRNSSPSGAALTRLTLAGGAIGYNWLPVHVAISTGIFARHGLDVELKRMGSVDKATAAVKEDEAELAITPPEGALADAADGGDLRILAGNVNRLPLTLIANPSIRSIEDLKGRTLGTSSMTEGTMIYTQEMLRAHGLNYPGDYAFSTVGIHTARWEALQDGRIDAAVQLVPYNFIGVDAGYSNLGEVTDYIPDIVFTALIARLGWAETNAATLAALIAALREATAFIYEAKNDVELMPIVLSAARIEDQGYGRRTIDYTREIEVFPRDLGIPEAALDKSLELMVKAGLLDPARRDAAAAALDLRFVEQNAEVA